MTKDKSNDLLISFNVVTPFFQLSKLSSRIDSSRVQLFLKQIVI